MHAETVDGVPSAKQNGRHGRVQAAAASVESAAESSNQQKHHQQQQSEDREQAAQRQPPPVPTANGMPADGLRDSGDQATPLPSQSSHWRNHMRSTSGLSEMPMASDDFEHTAEPIASSGLSDQESMLPIMTQLSYKDPRREVVLRLEAIVEREARVVIVVARIIISVAFVLLIAQFVLKLTKPDSWFITSPSLYIMNTCFASVLLAVALVAVIAFGRRMLRAKLSGKRWSRRRAFFSISTYVQLVVQTVSLVFFLLPNAYILANDCAWFDGVVRWSAFVRWECWAAIFLNFAILAHAANPWVNPQAPKAVAVTVDAPFWGTHWWKFGLMFIFTVCNLAAAAILQHDDNVGKSPLQPAEGADNQPFAARCKGVHYNCTLKTSALVLSCICVGILLVFLGLWIFFIGKAFATIQQQNYSEYRLANISVRIQMRNKGYSVVFFVVSLVLLFYVEINRCSSYAESWIGLLAPQVVLTIVSIWGCFSYTPKNPDLVAPVLQVWLQSFAWSEKGRHRKIRARQRMAAHVPELLSEPMFCFETAIRMFYWSVLVYRYESEHIKDNLYSLDTAMKLYDLDHFELLWERKEDTKVLLAWNQDRIVMSFRGTASLINVLADLQFWLASHPPSRGRGTRYIGTHPAVHAGFLRSWQANSLNKRIIQRIEEIVEQGGPLPHGRKRKILLTGHSLGGALAHLAAYDITKAFPGATVRVYTFGSPRVGNHAFAKDYDATVPDSWAIINDQDVVTRGAKLVRIYKRCGHRVFIDKRGFLLVRPSFSEISLRQMPWGASAKDHLLASYKDALISIMLRQFDQSKGFKDGMQGVMELMETIQIVRVEGHKPTTAREADFAAKLATLAGLGGTAAGRVAGAAADAASAVGGAADAAAAAGQTVLDHTSAVFHCVQPATEDLEAPAEAEVVSSSRSVDTPAASRHLMGDASVPEPPLVEQLPSRRGVFGAIRRSPRSSSEVAREGSVAASRRSGVFTSRRSMASDISSASAASGLPPGPGGIRSSGTYRRAAAATARFSAPGEPMPPLPQSPPVSQHGDSAQPGANDSPSMEDNMENDSSGTHHGSGAGLPHLYRGASLPEGLEPGGADIEQGITYEGGVRHHTEDVAAGEQKTQVTAEGHWPGERASMVSSACAPLQTH